MVVASAEDEETLARLDAAVARAKKQFEAVAPQLDAAQAQWEADVHRYAVTLPELARDSKATTAEKSAARAVQVALKKDAKARDPKERESVQTL